MANKSQNENDKNIQRLIDYVVQNGDGDVSNEEISESLEEIKNVIELHRFDEAKGKINEFSTTSAIDIDIKPLGETTIGFSNHVTCKEFNDYNKDEIIPTLKEMNEIDLNCIQEFKNVYDALESLDKDYIQGILVSLAENVANNKKIKKAQDEINGTIDTLGITVGELEKVRKKVDEAKHFNDIDTMWDDIKTLKQKDTQEADSSVSNSDDKRINEIGNSSINKKIKIAYAIAGSSLLLTVVQMVLHIFKVI